MGAPLGNDNAIRGKRWRDAIQEAIAVYPQEPDYINCLPFIAGLRRAAFEYVKRMMTEKDIAFFKEFGDRIDGRAAQSVEITADVTNRAAGMSDDALAEIANAGNRDQT